MAYPNVHYGDFGDEKVTSTSKIGGLPLGLKMALPDGREFRHARAGASALVAGKLYVASSISADGVYGTGLVLTSTAAVGAVSVGASAGATTAVTTDRYVDGWLSSASSAGTGIGYTYKVKSNNSTAASSTFTVTLYETDPIKVALAGGTTKVTLMVNSYNLVEISPASSALLGGVVGVACNSAAASAYCWLQTKGEVAVFVGATTLTKGEPVVPSTTVAGAVVPHAGSTFAQVKGGLILGSAIAAAETAGYGLVNLNIV